MKECTASCDDEFSPDRRLRARGHQLVMPFAGLRYVHFYHASSSTLKSVNHSYLNVFAHVIFLPFNDPGGDWLYLSGDPVRRNAIGARVGIKSPPFAGCLPKLGFGWSCVNGGLSLGYTPFPGFVNFETHLSWSL